MTLSQWIERAQPKPKPAPKPRCLCGATMCKHALAYNSHAWSNEVKR